MSQTKPAPSLCRQSNNRRASRLRTALGGALGLSLLCGAGAAQAGVFWQTERQHRGQTTTASIYIEGDHLRMESNEDHATVAIYDAATKRMIVLRPERRSYMEMGEEDMKRMRTQVDGQMAAARAQMEARMKNMPPEQRKMVEQMMAQNGMAPGAPAAPPPKEPEWTFQATGQKKNVSGFPCEVHRVLEGGAVKEEDCLSPWSKGLVTKDDIGALMRFAESMSSLMGGMGGGQVNAAMNRVHRLPGFPVQRVRATGPNESEIETLKKLERKALPKDLFTVPAGFTKEDPTAGRGRPPGPPPVRPVPPT